MRHRIIRPVLISCVVLTLMLAWAAPASAQTRTHIVQPGENLFRIALRYGVTVQAIQAANGLNGITIYVGQVLIIPDANAPAPQPEATQPAAAQPATPAAGGVHIVLRGETLFTISLKYNVNWVAVQQANGLADARIYAGQRLIIPSANTTPVPALTPTPATDQATPPPAPTPQPTTAPASDSGTVHIVQPGDTLFTIGLKYGLTWVAIQQANGLADTRIYAGQRLIIPGESGAATNWSAYTAPPSPSGSGRRFLVDLSEQRLYAFDGDTLVRTTLISSGLPQWPTVTGTYYIYLRLVSGDMTGPGYYLPGVPYVMYFYQGYSLHGTYWHSNFGTPMSHGCVNMPTAEAEWAYNWSAYGTPVMVQW